MPRWHPQNVLGTIPKGTPHWLHDDMAPAPARYSFVMYVILLWLYGAKESQHSPNDRPANFPKQNNPPGLNSGPHKKEPPALGPGVKSREEPGYSPRREGISLRFDAVALLLIFTR